MPPSPLVVGFDLDMTLIDTRPGVRPVWEALSAETGVHVDADAASSRLGPPLSEELARWFAPDDIPAMGDRFRALYPALAVVPTPLLPGAREAIDAVHRHGGRAVVITGKFAPNAQLHLDHLGLDVDELVGWVWGEQKGTALREHGASVYVGDHTADVIGARAGGALAVAVPTGPVSAAELAEAGADVVLEDLTAFPAWLDEHLLTTRLVALEAELRTLGSVVVAFSGGADSAFLLAAAARALGPDQVVAATAVSASLPADELTRATAFAAGLGVRHVLPRTEEMSRAGYVANAGDRCYFCKAELLDVLGPVATGLGLTAVATGTNADDAVAGFRPGIRAAAERSAVTPLLDAGLTKAQVREASRRWGLETWDKPAAACLSSRVAFGIAITPARLARVERAEVAARDAMVAAGLQVQDLRVRDLGDTARLEVDAVLVPALLAGTDGAQEAVLAAVIAAGFSSAVVDPRGFRSGAMNELLPDPAQHR